MNSNEKLDRDIERAAKSYKRSDEGRWVAAYFASRIVGRYQIGGTLALANRMGVSPDTIENLACAYGMYRDFREDPRYRLLVRAIRKLPYIYYGHFRALKKAQVTYQIPIEELYGLLRDVFQAEGELSLRDLEQHIHKHYKDNLNWHYYAERAYKQIHETLQQPDLPDDVRKALIPAHTKLGEKA